MSLALANDKLGHTQAAYDSLMNAYKNTPSAVFKEQMNVYGKKLGKDNISIDNEISSAIDNAAPPATNFTLKNYYTTGTTSLSDLKGKVVFITYWYPACGPCRGEFPHFENVIRKFKDQDLVYLGINIYAMQNDFVIPFLQSSGYSFIPLEEVDDREKGNLDNNHAAPVNFLINRDGRVVFSNFRTDGSNEDELETMIKLLLNKKK